MFHNIGTPTLMVDQMQYLPSHGKDKRKELVQFKM
jgi:hypothetical protein